MACLRASEQVALSSSLGLYAAIAGLALGRPAYYLDGMANPRATKLLTLLRLGQALLFDRVARLCKWSPAGAKCRLCLAARETMSHFLQCCPALSQLRSGLCQRLADSLEHAGRPGRMLLAAFRVGGDAQLKLLLGGRLFRAKKITRKSLNYF